MAKKLNQACVLAINGGSSSIKFALYQVGEALEQRLYGKVDRIGLSGTNLTFHDPAGKPQTGDKGIYLKQQLKAPESKPGSKPNAKDDLKSLPLPEVGRDQRRQTRLSGQAPGEVLSSGSVVRRGEGNSVVMLTGAKTYFGRTTELVQQSRPKLHIETVVAKVVRWLFVIVGA